MSENSLSKPKLPEAVTSIAAAAADTQERVKNIGANAIRSLSSSFSSVHPVRKVIYAIAFIVIVMIAFYIVKIIYNNILKIKNASPWIIRGTINANKRLVVRQDPSKLDSINLKRSKNQFGGLEFTYMWWMYIDDVDDKEKIVFYKGDSDGNSYAPKVELKNGCTTLKVSMNTFENRDESMEIHNIPMKKWIHVVLAVRQRDMDVYVNGDLAKRKILSSIPKQNSGNLYISPHKGFDGNISNFKYFNYFVTFKEIDQYLQLGPSKKPKVEEGDKPPYFSLNWWVVN